MNVSRCVCVYNLYKFYINYIYKYKFYIYTHIYKTLYSRLYKDKNIIISTSLVSKFQFSE